MKSLSFRRLILGFFLAFALVFVATPQETHAQQQNVSIQTICGTLNASWPDIAQVWAQILALVNSALQQLLQVGVGVNIGNILQCLPNINIQLPNIDLSACFQFNIQASCNFNAQLPNLQQCLQTALSSLQQFLQQLNININMNSLLQCLSGLINVNITIPDLLNILNGLLNQILGLLNSLSASISWYSNVFQFFLQFCQGYNANGGFNAGAGCGLGGSAGCSYSGSTSGGNGSLNLNLNPFGCNGGTSPMVLGATAASTATADIEVWAEVFSSKGKKISTRRLDCSGEKCSKKLKFSSASTKKYGKGVNVTYSVFKSGGNGTSSSLPTDRLPVAQVNAKSVSFD
ncbi:MAG: hypothetical protein K1X79_03380 [Oligoflexia bacterium]|nr:hypothetical protein [Oligoflexia bacterium]